MRHKNAGLLLLILSLVGPASFAQATVPPPPPVAPDPISYYGIYLDKGKLGSATLSRDETAKKDGKPAVRTEMQMRMHIRVAGAPDTEIVTTDTTWSDPKSGAPIAAEDRTEASGRVTKVETTYGVDSLTYTADVGGSTKTGTLTLKPGEYFLADPTDGVAVKPAVGMQFKGKLFIPELLVVVDAEVKIVDQETIQVNGLSVPVFRIVDSNTVETSTLFATDAGDILRIDNTVAGRPMQIVKQPKEVALAPPGKGEAAQDLSVLTSIRPTGESLDRNGRHAHAITYELQGVGHALAPNDSVQTISYPEGAHGIANVTVHAVPLPTGPTAPLFADPQTAPSALQPYLASTVYVPANSPEFQNLAHAILGSETDCARAAAKVADYVHHTVHYDSGIVALRTATDVDHEPRGVCRDYTTFFTAIARAAGLPTKQCVGIGYVGGVFGVHAWPEVWTGLDPATGKDRWIALDPTWGTPFADATHIKLVEGEVTDIFTVASDIGRYQIEVQHVD